MSSTLAVEIDGLVVRYGEVTAVDQLSLEARAGQVIAVLGRNGAGKTTTVETLEGYRRPASGTVRVLGLDPTSRADHRRLRRRVGVMLQSGGVYPAMGPAETLRLFASYYDDPVDPAGLLTRLGLEEVARTPWRRLSGGEKQRLSLALALVGRPEVIFLDEPTAGVDPHGRLAIRDEIAALRAAGVGVVLTTHDLEDVERLADQVVIIDRGRVAAAGTPADLTSTGSDHIRFRARAGLDRIGLAEAVGAPVDEDGSGQYVVRAAAAPATLAALTAWLAAEELSVEDLQIGRERLEDVFLRLTGEVRP